MAAMATPGAGGQCMGNGVGINDSGTPIQKVCYFVFPGTYAASESICHAPYPLYQTGIPLFQRVMFAVSRINTARPETAQCGAKRHAFFQRQPLVPPDDVGQGDQAGQQQYIRQCLPP